MTWPDHIFVMLFAVIYPLAGFIGYRLVLLEFDAFGRDLEYPGENQRQQESGKHDNDIDLKCRFRGAEGGQ